MSNKMTDAEKIKWFDQTIKWMEQYGSPDEAFNAGDDCDGPNGIYYDFVEQYRKVKEAQ